MVRTGKLTETVLKKAMLMYLDYQKHRPEKHGRISVKKLLGKDQGANTMEINNANIRGFDRVAARYNVDYAIQKDKSVEPPKYIVFFKGRDAVHNKKGAFRVYTLFTVIFTADTDFEVKNYGWNGNSRMIYTSWIPIFVKKKGGKTMGRLYTTLPLNDPTRQRYQNIIDNSRKTLAVQRGSEGEKSVNGTGTTFDEIYNSNKSQAKDTGSLSAQIRDGKIVDTWSDHRGSNSDQWLSGAGGRNDQQQALKELYEMMRGGFFGSSLF